jgi:3-oxoacyl-[acyl-carrier protein] reductase
MDLGLTGKVAMVAAASQGLGRAIAEALAREGCKISICSRREEVIQATAVALRRETHAEVIAFKADVTRPEDIQNWVQKTAEPSIFL